MRRAGWPARAVDVWLAVVWLAVVGSTLWLDAQLAPDIPKVDDWANFVPVLANPHLVTPAWLWSQTFDHRIPLARLGYLVTYYALGHDFRGASFLGTILLGVTALFGMIAARRVRGRSSVADAFFPLMMLHWGQAQNYVIGTGLHFNLTYVFYYPALFLLLLPAERFTVRRAAVWTLLVLVLPLCGMMGVVLAAPLAGVLLALGVARLFGTAEDRRSGAGFLLLGSAVVALIGFYFKDYVPPVASPEHQAEAAARGLAGQLSTGAIILSMALGWLGWENWPLAALFLAGVGVATAGVLVSVWYRQPAERWRAGALLAFLVGTAALIAGTGRARSWLAPEGLWFCTRYAVFSIPVLVFAYLVCLRYASTRLGSWIQASLAALAAVVFLGTMLGPGGYPHATAALQRRGKQERAFIRRTLEGTALKEVSHGAWYWEDETTTFFFGSMMKEHGLGLFGLSAERRSDYLDWWPGGDRTLAIGSRAAEKYLGPGWAVEGDHSGRNTNARTATFRFAGTPGKERHLRLELHPFLVPDKVERQRVRLLVNGSEVKTITLTMPSFTDPIPLPGNLVRDHNLLTLDLLDAVVPREIGYSEGHEPVAVRVKRLQID